MGVCMSYVSTIHLVDSLGASFDSALVEWKGEAETKMELVQVIFLLDQVCLPYIFLNNIKQTTRNRLLIPNIDTDEPSISSEVRDTTPELLLHQQSRVTHQ